MEARLRIAVAGATGRMGEAVARQVLADPGLELAALLVRPGDPALGTTPVPGGPRPTADVPGALRHGMVLIEFTSPEGVLALAPAAAAAGTALVSGTTALGEAEEAVLAAAARSIAVVHAPNMSRGIALLLALAAQAAESLADFDLEIEERHHRHKEDAPSGTALALARAVSEARDLGPDAYRHGRRGRGARTRGEVGIHALRGGDWVGEHSVILAGPGETIELKHRAESRAAFVSGAIAAARFAAAAPPGRYGMREVLARAIPAASR
jgi:4-hydroxy-tetrahydrodipicolinate reductase